MQPFKPVYIKDKAQLNQYKDNAESGEVIFSKEDHKIYLSNDNTVNEYGGNINEDRVRLLIEQSLINKDKSMKFWQFIKNNDPIDPVPGDHELKVLLYTADENNNIVFTENETRQIYINFIATYDDIQLDPNEYTINVTYNNNTYDEYEVFDLYSMMTLQISNVGQYKITITANKNGYSAYDELELTAESIPNDNDDQIHLTLTPIKNEYHKDSKVNLQYTAQHTYTVIDENTNEKITKTEDVDLSYLSLESTFNPDSSTAEDITNVLTYFDTNDTIIVDLTSLLTSITGTLSVKLTYLDTKRILYCTCDVTIIDYNIDATLPNGLYYRRTAANEFPINYNASIIKDGISTLIPKDELDIYVIYNNERLPNIELTEEVYEEEVYDESFGGWRTIYTPTGNLIYADYGHKIIFDDTDAQRFTLILKVTTVEGVMRINHNATITLVMRYDNKVIATTDIHPYDINLTLTGEDHYNGGDTISLEWSAVGSDGIKLPYMSRYIDEENDIEYKMFDCAIYDKFTGNQIEDYIMNETHITFTAPNTNTSMICYLYTSDSNVEYNKNDRYIIQKYLTITIDTDVDIFINNPSSVETYTDIEGFTFGAIDVSNNTNIPLENITVKALFSEGNDSYIYSDSTSYMLDLDQHFNELDNWEAFKQNAQLCIDDFHFSEMNLSINDNTINLTQFIDEGIVVFEITVLYNQITYSLKKIMRVYHGVTVSLPDKYRVESKKINETESFTITLAFDDIKWHYSKDNIQYFQDHSRQPTLSDNQISLYFNNRLLRLNEYRRDSSTIYISFSGESIPYHNKFTLKLIGNYYGIIDEDTKIYDAIPFDSPNPGILTPHYSNPDDPNPDDPNPDDPNPDIIIVSDFWRTIQRMVREEDIQKYYKLGDTLYTFHQEYGTIALKIYSFSFDGNDRALVLGAHLPIPLPYSTYRSFLGYVIENNGDYVFTAKYPSSYFSSGYGSVELGQHGYARNNTKAGSFGYHTAITRDRSTKKYNIFQRTKKYPVGGYHASARWSQSIIRAFLNNTNWLNCIPTIKSINFDHSYYKKHSSFISGLKFDSFLDVVTTVPIKTIETYKPSIASHMLFYSNWNEDEDDPIFMNVHRITSATIHWPYLITTFDKFFIPSLNQLGKENSQYFDLSLVESYKTTIEGLSPSLICTDDGDLIYFEKESITRFYANEHQENEVFDAFKNSPPRAYTLTRTQHRIVPYMYGRVDETFFDITYDYWNPSDFYYYMIQRPNIDPGITASYPNGYIIGDKLYFINSTENDSVGSARIPEPESMYTAKYKNTSQLFFCVIR